MPKRVNVRCIECKQVLPAMKFSHGKNGRSKKCRLCVEWLREQALVRNFTWYVVNYRRPNWTLTLLSEDYPQRLRKNPPKPR